MMGRKNDSMYEEDMGRRRWESLKGQINELSRNYSRGRNRIERERERRLKEELAREIKRVRKGSKQ